MQRAGLGRRAARQASGQQVATLAFAAHIQHQAKALHPVRRFVQQGLGLTLQQLKLDLAHHHLPARRADVALVQRQLNQRCAAPQHAPRALHVGGKALDQRRVAGAGQQALQRGTGGTAVVTPDVNGGAAAGGRVGGQIRQHHVVLEALHRCGAFGFQRLHPLRALSPQAQRRAGLGQVLAHRVHIHRRQRLQHRAAAGHGALQCGQAGGWDAELQLDFDRHGGHAATAPPWQPPWQPAPAA